MIRFLSLPALAAVIFLCGACKKSVTSSTNASDTSTATATGKKGADFSTNMTYGTWNGDIVDLKAFWYYTWGTPQPSPSPQNCEFVSMFWGPSNVTTANITAVQQLKAQGQVKYVLGFNEPDQSGRPEPTGAQARAWSPPR